MAENACPIEPCGLPIHDSVVSDWVTHEIDVKYGIAPKKGKWVQLVCDCGAYEGKRVYLEGTPEESRELLESEKLAMAEHLIVTIKGLVRPVAA